MQHRAITLDLLGGVVDVLSKQWLEGIERWWDTLMLTMTCKTAMKSREKMFDKMLPMIVSYLKSVDKYQHFHHPLTYDYEKALRASFVANLKKEGILTVGSYEIYRRTGKFKWTFRHLVQEYDSEKDE